VELWTCGPVDHWMDESMMDKWMDWITRMCGLVDWLVGWLWMSGFEDLRMSGRVDDDL